MLLNVKFLYKFYSVILSMIVFATIQIAHPTTFDRYFTQTVNQIYTKDKQILPYYLPLFETAIKISNSNKIFGLGPKSFRYYCSKPEFITYSSRNKVINNKVVIIDLGWKKNNPCYYQIQLNENIPKKYLNISAKKIHNKKKFGFFRKYIENDSELDFLDDNIISAVITPDKDIIPGAETLNPAYVVFDNYEVILKWNRSLRFALAVCTLKDKFKNEI